MIKLIESISEYRNQIISLWHNCFGDSIEYVTFFLDNCPDYTCIGYFSDDKLVSMLFLLNGTVNSEKCKYLYAACTDEKYRKQGIMENLIKFSEAYCKNNDISSIFLVPANEQLYSYYEKFGFISSFYKKAVQLKADSSVNIKSFECSDFYEICRLKESLLNNVQGFSFSFDVMEYTVKEHFLNGGKVSVYTSKNKTALFFYYSNNNNVIIREMLTDYEISNETIIKLFSNKNTENIYIYTPIVYNSKDIGEEYTKCGMCLPLNESMTEFLTQNSSLYAGMYLD